MKEASNLERQQESFESVERALVFESVMAAKVWEIVERGDRIVPAIEIQRNILKETGNRISMSMIYKFLKTKGYGWRKKLVIAPYVNSEYNIYGRAVFGCQLTKWWE